MSADLRFSGNEYYEFPRKPGTIAVNNYASVRGSSQWKNNLFSFTGDLGALELTNKRFITRIINCFVLRALPWHMKETHALRSGLEKLARNYTVQQTLTLSFVIPKSNAFILKCHLKHAGLKSIDVYLYKFPWSHSLWRFFKHA